VFGDLTFAAISDPRVRKEFLEWREKIAREAGEREADDRLSVVSAMFSWATDRGHIAVNHLRGFRRLYHSNRSENIWLPEHISPFMRVASIEMLRAMIIALHTGQRQGDILRLPWSSYDTTILEKYLARTRHLSDDAIDNFENSPRTEFANRLQTKTPQGRKKNDKP
jgi:integrase